MTYNCDMTYTSRKAICMVATYSRRGRLEGHDALGGSVLQGFAVAQCVAVLL